MIKPAKLLFPLQSFDKQLLLPTGTELTDEFLDQLLARNTHSLTGQFLLRHASVKKDLLHHISTPPYDVVFADHPMRECDISPVNRGVPPADNVYGQTADEK